jgi:RNA polymerase subunit RPABC4/transcription elongation factor Spt4
MPSFLTNLVDFMSSPNFGTIQIVALSYLGLLWLSIIIWVTRDSIHRSNSLLFQTFSILINIIVPILGVLFYLIIRPNRTSLEKYYEDLEQRMVEDTEVEKSITCEKCLTTLDEDYTYCPNCGIKAKKTCAKCKKHFPNMWSICPFCGTEFKKKEKEAEVEAEPKKHSKKQTAQL